MCQRQYNTIDIDIEVEVGAGMRSGTGIRSGFRLFVCSSFVGLDLS